MNAFYSKQTGGFYIDGIHKTMPNDVVCVSEEYYINLLNAQSEGFTIKPDENGNPISVETVIEPIDLIKTEIQNIENTITPRRLREAVLTEEGRIWLINLEAEIAALRAQL